MPAPLQPFVEHLALAASMGAAIGLERQLHQGLAGLRTNSLVATAAAAYVSLPALLNEDGSGPAHMAVAVITGIGFLGAGVILREGTNVRGLNTAATLWGTASMGAFVGAGLPVHAVCIAACIVLVNVCMRPVVQAVNRLGARLGTGAPVGYVVEVACARSHQRQVRALLLKEASGAGLAIRGLEIRDPAPEEAVRITADLIAYGGQDTALEALVGALARHATVTSARWSMRDSMENDPRLHVAS